MDNGHLWIDDGEKIITSNYKSDFAKEQKYHLINSDKEILKNSLRSFESPTYKIESDNYLIKIDESKQNKYRYASGKIAADESTKPNLILSNGKFEFQGSG